ncbi:hypothetical protein ASPCAL13511 [Aspergillus calidoustus]|uniref:Glutamate-1-semialdehyde 2,1-aminomutase n=1 Tax=Aspergillus calidoustus TaxID=454130 RepID=A0A0U5GGB3_ASPCI|nr:hypothetical protein ASPCAL13511 [Aspergillus calidoustus]
MDATKSFDFRVTSKGSDGTVQQLQELLDNHIEDFINYHPISQNLHQHALTALPGGNTRSVLHTNPFPVCMDRGDRNRLIDVDGHEYLDLIGEMTAGLCGHSNPKIRDAIMCTVSKTGLNLGATTVAESLFAAEICRRFPSVERLRFCNSGTEANLYALSIARRATGLSKIIVFSGAYHGGVLSFVHGLAGNNVDKSDWIIGKYNDTEGAQRLISDNKGRAAAVIVEGMQGAAGCIPGTGAFIHGIQAAAKANGMLFILDEVMTSRLAPGGLQSIILNPHSNTGLKPDITTLGKYIAGGMTIGAFGGREELLSIYDPRENSAMNEPERPFQPLSHSGTFNNNTLAMNVGLAVLSDVYTPEACTELNAMGDWFRQSILDRCQGTKMTVTGIGAVCNIHFLSEKFSSRVLNVEELEKGRTKSDTMLRDIFWFEAIRKGFWMARRGMLALIMGTTKSELQGYLDFVEVFVQEYYSFLV